MRIDESGDDDFAGAVDFVDLPVVLLYPGIAEGVFGRANRDDLPANGENSSILDDAELVEVSAAARSRLSRRGTQTNELADVKQEEWGRRGISSLCHYRCLGTGSRSSQC